MFGPALGFPVVWLTLRDHGAPGNLRGTTSSFSPLRGRSVYPGETIVTCSPRQAIGRAAGGSGGRVLDSFLHVKSRSSSFYPISLPTK